MSTRAEAMRAVVTAIAPVLKDAGFGKRRHCFNRTTGDGVVHVVGFQMSPHHVPRGSPTPPGIIDGSFTINLGAYVDTLAEYDFERRTGQWVHEYDCRVRARIGSLLHGHDEYRRAAAPPSTPFDIWWSLADVGLARELVGSALRDFGIPWLDALSTEEQVVALQERNERRVLEARATRRKTLPAIPDYGLDV